MSSGFSYHIFLLPFNWGKIGPLNRKGHFSQLVNLEDADKLVTKDGRWQKNLYDKFNQPEDYNEYVYFYPTVRDVLYDNNVNIDGNRVIRHYQFTPATGGNLKYVINIEASISKIYRSYELEIDYILLNLYKTGIGLLSYHLKNSKSDQQDWKDVLAINDFGRRIYPPYFDYSGESGFSANAAKQTSLAKSIQITGISKQKFVDITEDFEIETGLSIAYDSTKPMDLEQIPNHIKQILPDGFCKELNIHPTLDDRMFVVSSVYDKEEVYLDRIKAFEKEENDWIFSDEFYQYIFIDTPGSSGVANKKMLKDFLKAHLYKRWIGYGSVYGLSRYSLVSYTTWDKILVDTRTIYYKIAELCLLQRSSVIKFSEEVRRIATMDENESRLSAYINDLYKNYIIFINKIYFRDITPQEQGIELYEMLREKMRIEKEVTDLDREINELHEYAMLQEERGNSNRLQLLSVLGGLFIVPSLIIGFFGVNDIHINSDVKSAFIPLLFIIAFVCLIASLVAVQGNDKGTYRKYLLGISLRTWVAIIILIIIIFGIFILFNQ